MRTTVKMARLALIGSALLLMVSGMVLWTGNGGELGPVHALLGLVLAVSLWIIAGIAARAGVSPGIVALAVSWSLAAIVLGGAQEELLTGGQHWVIQSAPGDRHGHGRVGQGLVLLMRRVGARRERSAARTSGAEAQRHSAPLARWRPASEPPRKGRSEQ